MKLGLLVLIGLPGSGKTTLSNTLKNNFQRSCEKTYDFIHICYDDLIPFQNSNREFEWKLARNSLLLKIENLVIAIKTNDYKLCPVEFISQLDGIKSNNSDVVLIIDDNMYFKSMRYSFFQIARKYSLGFCQAFLSCSLENALMSNSSRDASCIIPPYIIENMNEKMEPPECTNNWEKFSVKLNSFCNGMEIEEKLFPVLNESLENPVQGLDDESDQRELSKLQCKKSLLHQADLACRKIINLKIKKFIDENPREDSKDYVLGLNVRKSEILSDIKTGNICIPENILRQGDDVSDNFQLINLLSGYF